MNLKSSINPAYYFLTPAFTAIILFFVIPVVAALLISFTDFDIYSLGNIDFLRWIGWENYRRIFADPLFWVALRNTLYFVVIGGPLSVAVSLATALLINHELTKFPHFFRTIFFLPVVTTLVAVAIVWRYLYHPRYGLFNYVLNFIGVESIDWLGDPAFAMPAIIILAVWKNFGFNMIIFIASLQSIPVNLYEAARIDGASNLQQISYITLPQLVPAFIFVGIMTMIGYFQLFAEPYVMTQGGPNNSTLSIVLFMYQQGFRWWNIGYASALAFVLFFIMLTATIVQNRLRTRVTT